MLYNIYNISKHKTPNLKFTNKTMQEKINHNHLQKNPTNPFSNSQNSLFFIIIVNSCKP